MFPNIKILCSTIILLQFLLFQEEKQRISCQISYENIIHLKNVHLSPLKANPFCFFFRLFPCTYYLSCGVCMEQSVAIISTLGIVKSSSFSQFLLMKILSASILAKMMHCTCTLCNERERDVQPLPRKGGHCTHQYCTRGI